MVFQAWNVRENNKELDLVDPDVHQYDASEVRRIIGIALACTQASPGLRPAMSRVVAMLSGDIEVAAVSTRPGYLTDWKFDDSTTFLTNIDDDTSTSNPDISHTNYRGTTMNTYSVHSPSPLLDQEGIGEGR